MLSSLVLRLKALSPFQIVGLAILALAVLGSSTAVASKLNTGADVKDRSLTGRDLARGTVSHSNLKDDSVTSRDIKDGTVLSTDLSPGVREQLANSDTGGVDGKDGTKGEKGDTGPQGPKGDASVGASGAFLVKDADDNIAGPMLTYNGGSLLTFYYKGRAFNAAQATGALSLQRMSAFYTTTDCSGTPYVSPGAGLQTALRVDSTSDTGIYELGDTASINVRSGTSTGACFTTSFTNNQTRLNPVPASELPPALHGPLRFVPAG